MDGNSHSIQGVTLSFRSAPKESDRNVNSAAWTNDSKNINFSGAGSGESDQYYIKFLRAGNKTIGFLGFKSYTDRRKFIQSTFDFQRIKTYQTNSDEYGTKGTGEKFKNYMSTDLYTPKYRIIEQ